MQTKWAHFVKKQADSGQENLRLGIDIFWVILIDGVDENIDHGFREGNYMHNLGTYWETTGP